MIIVCNVWKIFYVYFYFYKVPEFNLFFLFISWGSPHLNNYFARHLRRDVQRGVRLRGRRDGGEWAQLGLRPRIRHIRRQPRHIPRPRRLDRATLQAVTFLSAPCLIVCGPRMLIQIQFQVQVQVQVQI